MFTLVGWSQSQIGNPGFHTVTALADPHVRVVANDIVVPAPNQLIGAYAIGATLVQAQLISPSLRRVVNLDLAPLETAALPVTRTSFNNKIETPITLDVGEALDASIIDTAAGAEQDSVFAWLGDGNYTKPTGYEFTVRATSATASVAFAWTNVALIFTQTLPAGRYAITGLRANSTNMIAARFVAVGYLWRPGAIGFATPGLQDFPIFRHGGLGTWCEFEHNTPPTVDVLTGAANASQEFLIDLVKVG